MQEPVTDAKGAGYRRGSSTMGTGGAPGSRSISALASPIGRRVNVLAALPYVSGDSVKD